MARTKKSALEKFNLYYEETPNYKKGWRFDRPTKQSLWHSQTYTKFEELQK